MKRINREAIQRMVDARGGKAGGTSGGGGGSLAGYATQAWVNEGFVSVEFFNRLFTVYGPGETSSDPDVVVAPNDLDSTIKNIKAMFGLWTEQYLSALGLNPGGTGSATSLGMLDDVNLTTPTNGQALVYNATSLKWENGSGFLPLTGGTLTGTTSSTLTINTSAFANYITLQKDGTNMAMFGFYGTEGLIIQQGTYYASFNDGVYNFYSGSIQAFNLRTTQDHLYLNFYTNSAHRANICYYKGDGLVLQCGNYYATISPNGSFTFRTNVTNTVLHTGNTKTINGQSIYGSGDITISGGSSGNFLPISGGTMLGSIGFNDTESAHSNPYTYARIARFNYDAGLAVQFGGNADGNSKIEFVDKTFNYAMFSFSYAGNFYATGGITALSDMRDKQVNENADLPIEWIANAPAFSYYWKDKKVHDKLLHVGSSAQYWQSVLPEVVLEAKDEKGTLSMQYGVAALVSAIITARKVVDHERRIAELERENKELKERLKIA